MRRFSDVLRLRFSSFDFGNVCYRNDELFFEIGIFFWQEIESQKKKKKNIVKLLDSSFGSESKKVKNVLFHLNLKTIVQFCRPTLSRSNVRRCKPRLCVYNCSNTYNWFRTNIGHFCKFSILKSENFVNIIHCASSDAVKWENSFTT